MKRRRAVLGMVVAFSLLVVSWAAADISTLSYYKSGTLTTLAGSDYAWWYGCSPTSAGMMMGYYDRNGYGGMSYGNLVPGGVAEQQTYTNPAALANNVIASQGHVTDFYSGGINASGDDAAQPWHNFNSLADFMGTSQDAYGNKNGWTTFYYWTNGARFYASQAYAAGVWASDGMYGIDEYFRYAGYGTGNITTDTNFFTQLISTGDLGFTFADYMAEINAGREVMIQLAGHSMVGYGYDDSNNQKKVFVYDTWNLGGGVMDWGGVYGGMDQWGVTCFIPTGAVPLPPSFLLLGSGLGLLVFRRRFFH